MSATSHEFLRIAKEMSRCTVSEGWRRAVISRAYYAAYHRCREWEQSLPALGANVGSAGGMHQELINRLKHPDRRCSEVMKDQSRANGAQLEVQRARRIQADYRLAEFVETKEMSDQLTQVAELIARCDRLGRVAPSV